MASRNGVGRGSASAVIDGAMDVTPTGASSATGWFAAATRIHGPQRDPRVTGAP